MKILPDIPLLAGTGLKAYKNCQNDRLGSHYNKAFDPQLQMKNGRCAPFRAHRQREGRTGPGPQWPSLGTGMRGA